MSGKEILEAERLGFNSISLLSFENVFECRSCGALVLLEKVRKHFDWHTDHDYP